MSLHVPNPCRQRPEAQNPEVPTSKFFKKCCIYVLITNIAIETDCLQYNLTHVFIFGYLMFVVWNKVHVLGFKNVKN